jgi:hypothetical protein
MFYCERCNSGFNETVAATTSRCPRCFAKDGISAPLRFRLFRPEALQVAGLEPRRGEESRDAEPAQSA